MDEFTKPSDKLEKGETYEPLTLTASHSLNNQFKKSLQIPTSKHPQLVVPAVLLNLSSITQSPSFYLEEDVAAVGAKFEVQFQQPPVLEDQYVISWQVSDVYEKRSRVYQISQIQVNNQNGDRILQRKITNTFIGGAYLKRRVLWEKESGYRSGVNQSEFPPEGYEINARPRTLTLEQMRLFSGGLPGLNWPARNIHTDREISIRSGIGRPVASGIMFESYLCELMFDFFGEKWLTHGQLKLVAIGMAGEGDTVYPKAVIERRDTPDTHPPQTTMRVWCENQYGNLIMVGQARC